MGLDIEEEEVLGSQLLVPLYVIYNLLQPEFTKEVKANTP